MEQDPVEYACTPFASRISDYPEFSLSHAQVSHITVANMRYYFGETDTVQAIVEQHSFLNQGEQMCLETDTFALDNDMPLAELITTAADIQVFQTVVSKIANQEPIIIEDTGKVEKGVLLKLVQKVDTHNKQKGFEPGPRVQCKLELINREEAQQLTYRITKKTRLRDLVNFINKKTSKNIMPISISDYSGNRIEASHFEMNINQLSLDSRRLKVEYPPLLVFHNERLFDIALINSIAPSVKVKANRKSTILTLIDSVKQLTKDTAEPFMVQDRQNNVVKQQYWGRPLCSLGLRYPQLRLNFPKFLSFQCELTVTNLPEQEVRSFIYKVEKSTSLQHIVGYIRQKTRCFGGSFSLADSTGKLQRLPPLNTLVAGLQLKQKALRLSYVRPKCLIRSSTRFAVQDEEGRVQQMPVQACLLTEKRKNLRVLSYKESTKQVQPSEISCFRVDSKYGRLFRLEIAAGNELLTLECFEESNLYTCDGSWMPANKLAQGDRLLVLSPGLTTVTEGTVLSASEMAIDIQEELYSFEALPRHNFFANRLLMHNDHAVRITAYILQPGQAFRKQQINCFLMQSLCSIPEFKNKVVVVGGGLTLNASCTVGDYQLDAFGSVLVFEQGQQDLEPLLVISEWGKGSYVYSQELEPMIEKWRCHYMMVHESRIEEMSSLKYLMPTVKPIHVLVGPKINLEKLFFTQSVRPTFAQNSQQVLACYDFVEIPQKILQNKEKTLHDPEDIFPLYLYTTNYIYRDLNDFLRTVDKSSYKAEDVAKWYSLTNSIMRSLEKLENYQGVVYRGISNICLDKAFRINENKDKEHYLILDSFSSTTTEREVAEGFTRGRGALLKLHIHSGKLIEDYSPYPEKEVLLPPFLYFRITHFNLEEEIQQMTLEEIPFPYTPRRNLIFWVDDNPQQLENIELRQRFESRDIEVVQVKSTTLMRIILKDFLALIQLLGKRVVIISDMSRNERGIENPQAGNDLFNLLYEDYGKSATAFFIFVGHELLQREEIEAERSKSKLQLYSDPQKLFENVVKEFIS